MSEFHCDSCRASSINNELTDEAREWLVKKFAELERRYRPPVRRRRLRIDGEFYVR